MAWLEPQGGSSTYPESIAGAERALVALAMYDPASAFNTNVLPHHFYHPWYKEIWKTAGTLFKELGTVDPITTVDALPQNIATAIGGLAYLSHLFNDGASNASSSLAPHYAELVREASATRELLRLVSEVPAALSEGSSLPEVVDRVRRFLDTLEASSENECVILKTEVDRVSSSIQASIASGQTNSKGLVTGLGLEEYVPGGIPSDKLSIFFGETGTFKTAIKQWIADQIALSGRYVLDFSIEDSAELTAQRFIARHSGIPYGRIATGDVTLSESRLIEELTPSAKFAADRIIVVGNVPSTIDEAVRLSRHWKRKVDLAAVFLDYIQLLDTDSRANEAQELYRICITAQRAAHRDKVAWVLLSQMNRRFESREDKRPQLGDLYGSSAMQQACKLAVGIYRPWKYDPEPGTESPWGSHSRVVGSAAYRGCLELWIRKNVLGESDVVVPVSVDLATGRFSKVKL